MRTEFQQQNTVRVQIREAILSDHTPQSATVIAHTGVEVSQESN